MSKLDRVYTRKASDLEQKYNFGKSFAEVMGLANDAMSAAKTAQESTDSLDENLTSEEIFNRLTNNGELQGLYRGDDGELYVNANFIKAGILDAAIVEVRNLIADHLKSVLENRTLEINGGSLIMTVNGVESVGLSADEEMPIFSMDSYNGTVPKDHLIMMPDMIGLNGDMESYSPPGFVYMAIDDETGDGYLKADATNTTRFNGKIVTWKDNGDGTFSLIGTEEGSDTE